MAQRTRVDSDVEESDGVGATRWAVGRVGGGARRQDERRGEQEVAHGDGTSSGASKQRRTTAGIMRLAVSSGTRARVRCSSTTVVGSSTPRSA
ncbi:hypothetical protein PR202_gb19777 [Eleusine coracana subsp. coracana]|uniref:Uncharacterized protein n=1 Tax=Eleusine coracana subsp. coracana TaxID=191504 RepID=A0AAV5F931_ELECO|nr:hypothetical protein PR202_gb19777 [Eleusine coracana subsp. coracana]